MAKTSSILLRALGVWFIMLIAAIMNGAFRQNVFEPRMSEQLANQLSCLTGSTILFLLILALIKKLAADRPAQYWIIGAYWVALTVAFEFLVGHFVWHNPWPKLLHEYNLPAGRLWSLVLLVILISPPIAARLRRSSG